MFELRRARQFAEDQIVRMEFAGTPFRTALLAGLIAAGCVDSGLPGKNMPLEEARVKPPVYQTYDSGHAMAPIHFGDHDWMVAGAPLSIADGLLTPIEGAGDNLFALATDTEPYSRLYVRTDHGLLPLAPVPVQGEMPAAAEAEHH